MKFYVDYSTKKVTVETGDPFFQGENLVNKITFDVTGIDVSTNPFYLSVEFLLANGRKTTITTADAFGDNESTTETVGGVTYQIYNFSLTDTIMSCPGVLAFTCYINFTKTSGTTVTVKSRGVLVNGVGQVVKTTGYTSDTLLVLDSTDGASIVQNVQDEIVKLNAALANKANLTGNETVDFAAKDLTTTSITTGSIYSDQNGGTIGDAGTSFDKGYFGTVYEGGKSLSAKYHPLNGDYTRLFKASSITVGDPDEIEDEPSISIANGNIKIEDYGGTLFNYNYANATFWVGGTTTLASLTVNGKSTFIGVSTFKKSPVVPTPSNDTDAANKNYVDTQDASMLANAKTYAKTFGKSLAMDSSTYVISLKDADGNVLSSVDLPLETMVVSASYSNGYITLKLKNGNTLTFSVSDLISGLATTSYVDTQDAKSVHLTGDETIAGEKTFTGNVVIDQSSYGCFQIKNSDGGVATIKNLSSGIHQFILPAESTGTLAIKENTRNMTTADLNEILEVFD